MFKPRVYKSTDVIFGEKKELEINLVHLPNIIKGNLNESNEETDGIDLPEINLEALKKEAEEIQREAQDQRELILQEAQREAAQIIEEAYQDSKTIFEKAREDGYHEGVMAGKEQGYQEVDQIIQEACDIKQQTIKEKQVTAKELEESLIQLVIQCTKKVIHHEIQENHELLMNLIREGLEKCTFSETLVIKTNELDYDIVSASKNKIYMMTKGIESLEIKIDSSLTPGSVLIETLSGTIDSSIDTQIETVEKLFNELLRSE